MIKLYAFTFIFIQNMECLMFENKENRYKDYCTYLVIHMFGNERVYHYFTEDTT